jgi:hypothetical protein
MLRDEREHLLMVAFTINVEGRGTEFVLKMNIMAFYKYKAIVKELFFQNICQWSRGGNFIIFK